MSEETAELAPLAATDYMWPVSVSQTAGGGGGGDKCTKERRLFGCLEPRKLLSTQRAIPSPAFFNSLNQFGHQVATVSVFTLLLPLLRVTVVPILDVTLRYNARKNSDLQNDFQYVYMFTKSYINVNSLGTAAKRRRWTTCCKHRTHTSGKQTEKWIWSRNTDPYTCHLLRDQC